MAHSVICEASGEMLSSISWRPRIIVRICLLRWVLYYLDPTLKTKNRRTANFVVTVVTAVEMTTYGAAIDDNVVSLMNFFQPIARVSLRPQTDGRRNMSQYVLHFIWLMIYLSYFIPLCFIYDCSSIYIILFYCILLPGVFVLWWFNDIRSLESSETLSPPLWLATLWAIHQLPDTARSASMAHSGIKRANRYAVRFIMT